MTVENKGLLKLAKMMPQRINLASLHFPEMTHIPPLITAVICAGLLSLTLQGCDHNSAVTEQRLTNSSDNSNTGKNQQRRLAIRIDGNKFRNERGEIVQLRGVNLMGMEYIAIAGVSPANPLPTVVDSTWGALHQWRVNVIRIPLNEISYLGLKCVWPFTGPVFRKAGNIHDADPGHNYKKRLKEIVDRATAENLYVILDLHATAPDDYSNAANGISTQCAFELNPLPDQDHAPEFWKELASTYKDYPNVMFELFNNPYIDEWPYFKGNKRSAWQALRDGTVVNLYLPLWPSLKKHTWRSAGMQQLLDTVRSTGATNVILQGSISHSSDLELWLTYKAIDPLNQTAAAWHAFPGKEFKWGERCYNFPGPWCDERAYSYASAILAAGYPVIVTEFGDKNSPGTTGAPFVSSLLPHLDALGISYLGWTFSATALLENQLIKDNFGTPTDGYGEYVKKHYLCAALKTTRCNAKENSAGLNPSQETPQSPQSAGKGWDPLLSPI
ncbi:MAG TPA: cellulase family glycosylhydrolase [Steroidobacteraceae bacterium]|nr:cellulase family glycosylhydrolase [Steroidobacteraceae bacterium]